MLTNRCADKHSQATSCLKKDLDSQEPEWQTSMPINSTGTKSWTHHDVLLPAGQASKQAMKHSVGLKQGVMFQESVLTNYSTFIFLQSQHLPEREKERDETDKRERWSQWDYEKTGTFVCSWSHGKITSVFLLNTHYLPLSGTYTQTQRWFSSQPLW